MELNEALGELRQQFGTREKHQITFRKILELAATKLDVARDITDGSDPAKVLKAKHSEAIEGWKATLRDFVFIPRAKAKAGT